MAIVSVADLVDELVRHHLLTQAQEKKLIRDLQGRYPDPRALAGALVRHGWMTDFQTKALFQGRAADLVLGPYVLLERLGEGGMGQVFKARQHLLERVDALKVIRPDRLTNPDSVNRFVREAQLVARLKHPNIVAVYFADRVDKKTLFLAMEYLDGIDLARLVREGGVLPVRQVCDYIRQAALGLEHAHEHGLVHRDIKPSNLLLTRPAGKPGEVKVLDLGLGRLAAQDEHPSGDDHGLTRTGMLMGTPDYMAPEQASDFHTADIRADIYSLGCTFYHLLAGQVPFTGKTVIDKLHSHETAQPPPVTRRRSDVPAKVQDVLDWMMAKRPADRPQTPAEVAAVLARFCGEPAAAGAAAGVQSRPGRPGSSANLPQTGGVRQSPSDSGGRGPREVTPAGQQTERGRADTEVEAVPHEAPADLRRRRQPLWRLLAVGGVGLGAVLLAVVLVVVLVFLKGGGQAGPGPEPGPGPPGEEPPPEPPPPPTLVVAKMGEKYTTIRDALSDAKDGWRILVKPGVYEEGIILHKNVQVVGDGPRDKVVIESSELDCINNTAESATVRGLTLRCQAGTKKKKYSAVDIPQGALLLEDCDITCDALACVAVRGPRARPTIRRCKIHDGASIGISFTDKAGGLVEDCDLSGHPIAEVAVARGADPTLRKCKLHDSKEFGLLVLEQGLGRVERCTFFGNTSAAVTIRDKGNPTLVHCTLRDGKSGGLWVFKEGAGTLEDCEVSGNVKAGAEIKEEGTTVLRRCKFFNGKIFGVYVWGQARPRLEDCEISGNDGSGLFISELGNPVVVGCKIHDGKKSGVAVEENGRGKLEDCDITGNTFYGVLIRTRSDPVVRRCRINRNGEHGVASTKDAAGTVEECDLTGNSLGPYASEPGSMLKLRDNKQ